MNIFMMLVSFFILSFLSVSISSGTLPNAHNMLILFYVMHAIKSMLFRFSDKETKKAGNLLLADCRQSDFEAAEGLGKQIRFPNRIRSRNSFPTRKTASSKAFKLMELVCLFLCLSKSKS